MASQAWDLHANSNGRFVLGLGSQVKGHNERRFGIPWSAPAPRLRDYVRALRAVWRCWETGGKLDYQGEHYRLTLMTPDFSPEPTGLPMVPVTIAAVGEAMLRVAGEVCDGVRLHPLCSRRYLEEVALPRILEGMQRSGRSRANFDLFGGGFVVTGPDEKTVAERHGLGARTHCTLCLDPHLCADPRPARPRGTRCEIPLDVGHGPVERHAGRDHRRCRADLRRLRHL